MNILVLTDIPSPYQVELFNALARRESVNLQVCYVRRSSPGRKWQQETIAHEAIYLRDIAGTQRVTEVLLSADLVVFSHYRDRVVRRWMRMRHASGQPWCFWGERPGFEHDGLVGRWFRRLMLWPLYRSKVPIWGIGSWAVEGYARELGGERRFYNVPYASNLERFIRVSSTRESESPTGVRLLYSGSLSKRKGVDLLAAAFAHVSQRNAGSIKLEVVGDGPLRSSMEQVLQPVREQVTFHGFQPWHRLPAFYAAGDVLVAPSRYDGWGLIVPEGLAAGLPVVATHSMGAAIDLVEPETNGWIVPAGDLDALIKALQSAVTSQDLSTMKDAAVASVQRHQLQDGVERFLEAAEGTVAYWQTAEGKTA